MRYLAPRVSDTPRPECGGVYTHTHTHICTRTLLYTPGLWRWMEFATLQWAFDAKTMEEAARIWHTVCASVFLRAADNMGSTLPGPSSPWLVRGVVGNSVLRAPKNDVEVSWGSERWLCLPYWQPLFLPRHKNTLAWSSRLISLLNLTSNLSDARVASPITAPVLGQQQIIICYSRAHPLLVKLIEVKRRCGPALVFLCGCGSSLVLKNVMEVTNQGPKLKNNPLSSNCILF